jgi:hypothetical protein
MPGLASYGAPPPTPPSVLEELAVGTLTADGTEQTIVESNVTGEIEGWIDLANMALGDSVTIKIYVKMKLNGSYRLYDSTTYSDVQTYPAIHIVKVPSKYGFKVTLQQTAGTYKNFDYNFFRRA